MHGPNPNDRHPVPGFDRVGFLKNFVSAPNVEIGDFTYYDDPEGAEKFVERNILYHYEFTGDRLIIGKFCAIATGASFVMNGANHATEGFSTFPFVIFGKGWEKVMPSFPNKGDTVVGNDVWIGRDATIMPGVTIGDGAVIASKSVVSKDVAPYSIVAGNPAREVKRRFSPEIASALQDIRWWDWPVEKITANLAAIQGCDLDALKAASK